MENIKIINIKNAQENTEKHQSRGNQIPFIGMERLIFTCKGNQNLLNQQHVSRALFPCVDSVRAEIYLAKLCICSKILQLCELWFKELLNYCQSTVHRLETLAVTDSMEVNVPFFLLQGPILYCNWFFPQ
jgi:hypothetical protein